MDRPLDHGFLSNSKEAGVGFEPTKPCGSGFAIRSICPLWHPAKSAPTVGPPLFGIRSFAPPPFRSVPRATSGQGPGASQEIPLGTDARRFTRRPPDSRAMHSRPGSRRAAAASGSQAHRSHGHNAPSAPSAPRRLDPRPRRCRLPLDPRPAPARGLIHRPTARLDGPAPGRREGIYLPQGCPGPRRSADGAPSQPDAARHGADHRRPHGRHGLPHHRPGLRVPQRQLPPPHGSAHRRLSRALRPAD